MKARLMLYLIAYDFPLFANFDIRESRRVFSVRGFYHNSVCGSLSVRSSFASFAAISYTYSEMS